MSDPGMVADGKLVRDLIPDLIRANGEVPISYQADLAEYRRRLREKLLEEVDEFLTAEPSDAIEELADVLEVVYALAADLGTDQPTLDHIRDTKATEKGAFAHRVVWRGIRAE